MTAAVTAEPSVEQVWTWLADVPDPEIPVISVVDLGIVRRVSWQGEVLAVEITPTYSGCPATSVIGFEIEQALRAMGVRDIRIERKLSPAWTTDWISEVGREKLRNYGIAPPAENGAAIACPQCGSDKTEKISQFGSTPCKAAYRCTDCLEPFDYFKCL